MPRDVHLLVNGQLIQAQLGHSVAASLLSAGVMHTRLALDGAPRTPFCGMGVCMECRVRIDGVVALACICLVRDGMEISTDA